MKNLLVTGGAGFIGANFIHYILKKRPEVKVINVDVLTYAGNLDNLNFFIKEPRYSFYKADILDTELLENLLREHRIDTIVHFAAESHVDRSLLNPSQFIDTNVKGTLSLLEAARKAWLLEKVIPYEQARFHHVSTDEVFGSLRPDEPAFTEETPYAPNSPYAASKAGSDHLVRAYYHTYNLPISISHCSNNYGRYQFPEKLIPLLILNAKAGKSLPIYGDGKQIRDWIYVDDHCEAISMIIDDDSVGETYNLGGLNQPTNMDIVSTICDLLDELLPHSAHRPHISLVKHVVDRPGHDRRYAMNISKIQKKIGWQPKNSLEEGLRKTVCWYLENEDWVEKILKRSDFSSWMQHNYQKR